MFTLLKAETIYVLKDDHFNQFEMLIKQNPHVKAFIGDSKRGYLFQYRLIFDTYQFLTLPMDELIIDHYRTFERPINTYLHEIFCKQQELLNFKLAKRYDPLLCLLVSIFISKKIISILYDLSQSITANNTFENLLDLVNPSDQSFDAKQQQIIIHLQATVLQSLKQLDISYNELVTLAIQEARDIYYFMLGVR